MLYLIDLMTLVKEGDARHTETTDSERMGLQAINDMTFSVMLFLSSASVGSFWNFT